MVAAASRTALLELLYAEANPSRSADRCDCTHCRSAGCLKALQIKRRPVCWFAASCGSAVALLIAAARPLPSAHQHMPCSVEACRATQPAQLASL